jgi:predicted lipoprotein with Yx(FWY)xxD motif
VHRNVPRLAIAVVCVIVIAVVVTLVYARPSRAKGVEVRVETSREYGSVLVVDGGELGGFPLYEFSGDVPGHLGCGTVKEQGYDLDPDARVALTCTGPEDNIVNGVTSDDWPALTSKAKPVAGPGVDQSLLGTVHRKGIGNQVTYAGHPLYLFDPSSAPFRPLGVQYVETVQPLAPWHGYWYLVASKDGDPVAGVASMKAATLPNGTRVLGVEGDPNIDPFAVVVYTFSRDLRDTSTCAGMCAAIWVPVTTTSMPHAAPGIPAASIGTIRRSNGVLQVTYDDKPLYLYSRERVLLLSHGGIDARGTAGNGEGAGGPGGGTFSTVILGPS